MARYIDADAFEVFGYNKTEGASEEYNNGFDDGVQYVLECIDNVPTEDVKPVVRGEWIKMDKRGNNVRCSKCGNTLDLRGVNVGRGDANFCPNCGAKMSTQSNAFLTHKKRWRKGD